MKCSLQITACSVLFIASLVGCGSSQSKSSAQGGKTPVAQPAEAGTPKVAVPKPTMLDPVKQLAGTWEMKGPDGTPATIVYSVGSAGSAVREIMFPGQPHEMTNMYHMDGNTLVVTHYCAGGNQPRMRATSVAGGVIDFKFDSVTNLATPQTEYMGGLRLVILDKDHMKEEWRSIENGKVTEGPVFELTRKN